MVILFDDTSFEAKVVGKDPKTEGGGNGFIIRIKNVKYKSGTRNVCTNNGKIVGIPGKFGMDSSCRFGG